MLINGIRNQQTFARHEDLIGLHGLNKMSEHKSDRVTFFCNDYLRIVPDDDGGLGCSSTFSY